MNLSEECYAELATLQQMLANEPDKVKRSKLFSDFRESCYTAEIICALLEKADEEASWTNTIEELNS